MEIIHHYFSSWEALKGLVRLADLMSRFSSKDVQPVPTSRVEKEDTRVHTPRGPKRCGKSRE